MITWNVPIGGEPLIAPYPIHGRPFLTVAVDPAEIIVPAGAELWGIYFLDETVPRGKWLYYIPGFVTNTLTQLEPGKYYYVVVSASCILSIPQDEADYLALIDKYSKPIHAYAYDKGGAGRESPPAHDPYKNPSNTQLSAECLYEAGLRYFIFGSNAGVPDDYYYWEQLEDKWQPVDPGFSLGLPVAIAGISKGSWAHWVCALPITEDKTKIDSWLFFNFDEVVKPGNPRQMPYGSIINLFDVIGVDKRGLLKLKTNPFASFNS